MSSLGDLTPTAQGGVEVDPDTFVFYGETFRTRGAIGLMPLVRFAYISRTGVGLDDMDGLAAVYEMVRDCLHPDDWDRFQETCAVKGADEDAVLGVVRVCIQAAAARPSLRPSDSQPGSPNTDPSTKADAPSPDSVPATPAPDGPATPSPALP
jgi:hypothetical protein